MDEQERREGRPDGSPATKIAWPRRLLVAGFALLTIASSCGVVLASRDDRPSDDDGSSNVGGITVTAPTTQPPDETDDPITGATGNDDEGEEPTGGNGNEDQDPPPETEDNARLPDLQVSAVTSTSVVVVNVGEGAAPAFTISVSGTSFAIGGLASGASAPRTFECREGTLTATADSSNAIRESNEQNNVRVGGPFTCDQEEIRLLPDLVVTSLRSESVTVSNRGDARAAPFNVTVSGDNISFTGLVPGDSAEAGYPCRDGTLTATVDTAGSVEEADESNNSLTAGPFTCPRPDLVVTGLSRDSVTVRNRGTASAPGSAVSVTGLGNLSVPRLDPGASATQSFPCSEGTLTAEADPSDSIAESDETNNKLTAGPFSCPKPDLVIVKIESDQTTVANEGEVEASPFVVSVNGVGDFNLGALGPGATRVVGYKCQEGRITAIADSLGQVNESNENNNSLTVDGLTCPAPDLVISDLTATQVTVTNIGAAAAGSFVVFVSGVGTFQVGGLDAGQSAVIQFNDCFEGILTAAADDNNDVAESDETNNKLTKDVGIC